MSSSYLLEIIRKKTIHLKIFTFFNYFISVFYMVFILIWLNQNNVSVAEIFGYNIAIVFIIAVFSNTFSHISDKMNNRLIFIQISNFTYAIGVLFIAFKVNIITIMIYAFLTNFLSRETFITALIYEVIEKREILTKVETINFERKKAKEYAKTRIMGSFGWATGAPIAGYLMEMYGFPFAFLLCTLGYIILAFYFFILTKDFKQILNIERKDINTDIKSLPANNKILHRKFEFLGLLITAGIFEIGLVLSASIKAVYATELGGSLVFVGLLACLWASFELPLFYISSKITEKYNYIYPLMLGVIFILIKNLFYIYIITPDNIFLFLLLEILNQFGIMWPALTYAVNQIFAKQRKALGTSLYISIIASAGFFGNLLGMVLALLYNIGGSYQDYHILFVFSLIFTVIALICYIILIIIRRNYNKIKKILPP